MSLFVWYFGTRRRYEDVYHHTMVLGPRYRELLEDIFKRDKDVYIPRGADIPSLDPSKTWQYTPIAGLREGMAVAGDVESLGRRVTAAVVQAIFAIIFLDAVFAMIFLELNW